MKRRDDGDGDVLATCSGLGYGLINKSIGVVCFNNGTFQFDARN